MPEMPPFCKWKVPATSVATVWGTAVTWVGLVSWQSRRKLVADVQKNNDGKRKMWADTCRSKFKSWGILRDGADHLVNVCMSVDFLIYCREIRLVTGWWRNSYWCVCVCVSQDCVEFSPVFWVWENLISFPPPPPPPPIPSTYLFLFLRLLLSPGDTRHVPHHRQRGLAGRE